VDGERPIPDRPAAHPGQARLRQFRGARPLLFAIAAIARLTTPSVTS